MKLNCDSSFIPNLNSVGFACVIRDSIGNWVTGSAETMLETSVFRCELLLFDGVFFLLGTMVIERNWTVNVQLIQRFTNLVADIKAKEVAIQRLPHAEWLQAWNSILPSLARDSYHPS
ncbi:hypothetical protein PIB30_098765 [Stylosanthes scabra]|uniref:RNase H type-1 domain-containing protein n=1 Tax=Stylosanthes scabra TaxID=79078 RepID=A0ABU6WZ95_9FABA|nr:hypothetical protein [Stylosanthes scabra]